MGVELAPAAAVDPKDRHRPGLPYPNPLAGNPPGAPRYGARVRRRDGSELTVACPVATRLMVALMDMDAVLGGSACHWGGPAALAELMSAIHGLMFLADPWHQSYNFVNDAGHTENGLYALRANYGFADLSIAELRRFRSLDSRLTGHGEAHLFPEAVMISNGPLGSGLGVAQGLAMADRLADRARTTICVISDGALYEGEAKEAVSAIPGLAAKGLLAPFVMVISDNNTKLSGRCDADAFAQAPYFRSLAAQGWTIVRCEQGNDLQAAFSAVEEALARAAADPLHPVALWATTIKGFGVASTMKSASGGHGYPLSAADAASGKLRAFVEEIAGGRPLPEEFARWLADLEAVAKAKLEKAAAKPASALKTDKIQAGFAKAMIAAAKEGLPLVSISADLQGSTGVAPFRSAFPQLSFEVGVAEANMVSVAAGFSKQGYVPVVDTFAQFGVTKGLLPLIMANLSQAPVIAVYSHTGFQDAADGASHQALMYIAMTAAIPHTVLYCPASAEEAEWAMAEAIRRFVAARRAGQIPESVVFFCGRENFPISLRPEGASYAWGQAMRVAGRDEGPGVVISACGSMVWQAVQAARRLEERGRRCLVLNNATPNQPDVATHAAALARMGGALLTVDDHQVTGGAGELLVARLAAQGCAPRVRCLGVRGEFGQSAYTADELYRKHGIGVDGIVAAAQELAP
ncbi:MAG: transketolase C-terminal domain-containing protein [Planctomycetota bacterium]|nr:transketolase C-terminal domain-containing protein [Planctomycetota bacterium]